MPEPGVFTGADDVLDPGVNPVGGVGVSGLAAPAPRVSGQVRRPERVPPAAGRLEEGQLGAGVRPLAAGEDPHRLRPAPELVAVRALAQQPGQLGDVRLFYPAGRVRAAEVPAGLLGAALADLARAVDRGFPGGLGDLAERGLLAGAQRPA